MKKVSPNFVLALDTMPTHVPSKPGKSKKWFSGLEKVTLFGGLVYVVTYTCMYRYVLYAKSKSMSIKQRKIFRSRWFDKCSGVGKLTYMTCITTY